MKRVYSVSLILLISLFIYVFYRTEKTVINELFILLLSFNAYSLIKDSVIHAIPLNQHLIYSLPGGLWIFCATALSQGFYFGIRSRKIRLDLIPIVFALGLELCQLIHFTHGTFDLWDVASYLVFWLLAYYSFQPGHERRDILSPFTPQGFICLACFLSVYLAHVSR